MSLKKGYYKGGRFVFNFKVGPSYPHEAPKVKCETKVYHPNIDLEGNVCLNILRFLYGYFWRLFLESLPIK
jgi:ubiquitin-conjugating enzyme E2 M